MREINKIASPNASVIPLMRATFLGPGLSRPSTEHTGASGPMDLVHPRIRQLVVKGGSHLILSGSLT